MKNKFPRIYGLSTLGIIYHFNTDYLFHSFRTDFSGEGGSGKTMIADMIQLILVGPGVYKSATEANDDRPIEGLVLQPKNKGYGAGYILLNIEVSPNQFIAIGCFIEKSSKQTRMFIAQSGFDWENNLQPLSKPIYYKDLLYNNKIVSVEELQENLEGINIKVLSIKQYHNLLFNNQILPIDLSENKKTLESYAKIFRSFSRGSGFKTDSKNLKGFLFGDDDKALLTKYTYEVKSINDDYQEHDRYKKEIDLIDRKQTHVKNIVSLHKECNEHHRTYLTNKIYYWVGLQSKYRGEFETLQKKYNEIRIERQCIDIRDVDLEINEIKEYEQKYKNSKENLFAISESKQSLKQEKEAKYKLLLKAEQDNNDIKLVDKWLSENGNNIEQLKHRYQNEVSYSKDKKLLDEFINHLNITEIKDSFEVSMWLSDFTRAHETFEHNLSDDNRKKEQILALSIFSDIQNPDSLANWAINHFDRPLTIEEESMLVYFQSFPRHPNTLKERYLPLPEALFRDLERDYTAEGFWLNLDGVFEFIKFVSKQYLNIDEKEKKKAIQLLLELNKNIKEELHEITNSIESKEHLRKKLFEFPRVERIIPLYNKKEKYSRNPLNEYIIEEDVFHEYLRKYSSKENIEREYNSIRTLYEELIRQEGNIDPNNYENQFKESKEYFQNINVDISQINEYLAEIIEKRNRQKEELVDLQQKLGINDWDVIQIEKKLFENKKNRTSVLQLKANHVEFYIQNESLHQTILKKFNEANENLDSAKKEFQSVFKESLSQDYPIPSILEDPDNGEQSLKAKYERARFKFEEKYNLIVSEIEEGEQLKDTFHIGQLAYRLLPTVFPSSSSIDESQVEAQLKERLDKLHQTLKEIGSRKIEILKRVFTEVNKTFREYLDKVNKIDQYFENPNKTITGGSKASLKYVLSTDYPPNWMGVFTRLLSNKLIQDTPLFAVLSDEIDINEMMLKAFINEGGTKAANIEDLLNPKSYFDLKFDLRLDSGERNSGSNSQTYSGNALLGLARLSLIEDSKRKGIRIMPIDEAQGLGSNYEMLRLIAIEEGYQILTMSIDTAGEIVDGEQYIYMLSENKLLDEGNYVPAMGIFSENQIIQNIEDFINGNDNQNKE